ncbi:hypothetical protein FB567DRAFT_81763 [Paraphoma chrysanthemicola]|uniref:Uncharacterized protein n=1 Tax=Paraphoma chrysanthemicola TaxID=798071 RepID=A0A8K0VXQ4_9PLEO|nr:hypothetical protein FB567DRAFT_81763 [Paraphoma chrysanthemicola]
MEGRRGAQERCGRDALWLLVPRPTCFGAGQMTYLVAIQFSHTWSKLPILQSCTPLSTCKWNRWSQASLPLLCYSACRCELLAPHSAPGRNQIQLARCVRSPPSRGSLGRRPVRAESSSPVLLHRMLSNRSAARRRRRACERGMQQILSRLVRYQVRLELWALPHVTVNASGSPRHPLPFYSPRQGCPSLSSLHDGRTRKS